MAGQDDADQRVNGLMATLGKRTQERDAALARLAEFEAQGGSQAQDGGSQNSQPQSWEPGTMLEVGDDGQLVAVDPPRPRGNNAARQFNRSSDDGSAEYAKAQLHQALGIGGENKSWP